MTNKAEVIMMFRDSPGAGKDLTAPAVKRCRPPNSELFMSLCTLRGFYLTSLKRKSNFNPQQLPFRSVKEELIIIHLHTRLFETGSIIILRHKEMVQYTSLRKISEYVYVYCGML